MKRRLLVAAGMSALLIATLAPGAATARNPERFGQADVGGRKAHLDRLPSQMGKNRLVNVAVELEGRPVAVYQGAALATGGSLSESRKQDIRNVLGRRQTVVAGQLRRLDASIQARYTDVFNGFRIRVRARQVAEIASLPGVKAVYPVQKHTRSNANTVPYIGADKTWGQTGYTGKGVKIAVIDTGINYYHVGFAGTGYADWQADDGLSRDDDFPTAKVVDGYDLVGDAYNADSNPTPQPDPDPLDCKAADSVNVQHGTHVAGTAAGTGVTAAGDTYKGSYTGATLDDIDFRIAPGVAPEAKLMAFRVFGCSGGTYVVVDAIEMAVRRGADVINMSLGSPWGNPGSLDAVASNNAGLAGVTVVTSSGNEGPSAYLSGSPGSAIRNITVAAMDAQLSFPGATVNMATGADIDAINANGGDLPVSGVLDYFVDDPSTAGNADTGAGYEQSGCTPASFTYNGFQAGQIAAVQRGFCARVAKAQEGDKAGAAAVVMINNASGLPPFENDIAQVDIPFIGVSIDEDARFVADDGQSITIRNAGFITNPTYRYIADFSSAGPGRIDDLIKPDVAAPGVSTFSVDGSTVKFGKSLSGTSMASPAVAGVAALVKEAHPNWLPSAIKAAIVGTASANKVKPYSIRQVGAGLVQPRRAVDTKAFVTTEPGSSSIAFSYQPAAKEPGTSVSFSETKTFTIANTSNRAIRYTFSNTLNGPGLGLRATISPASVTVPAGGRKTVRVTASLSEAAAAKLPDSVPMHGAAVATDIFGQLYSPISTVAGVITARPNTSGNGIYPLRIPWLVVPRGISDLLEQQVTRTPWVTQGDLRTSSVKVRNGGIHRGIADLYAWGLQDGNDGLDGIDLRAAGVQSVPASVCDSGAAASDRCLVFAVNTWSKWSTASENEYDILVDTNKDGTDDYLVAGIDAGLVFGSLYGVTLSLIVDLGSGSVVNLWLAAAGMNGSTLLLPALASDLGLSEGGTQVFTYHAEAYEVADDDGSIFQFDLMTTGNHGALGSPVAWFDAFDPVLNTGEFKLIGAGATKAIDLSLDKTRYLPKDRGQKGWMIVTLEDASGPSQADLVPVGSLD